MGLDWIDYVIMATFLSTSLAIGVYHAFTGGRQRTTQEFIMADRKQGILPIMLSLLVSYESALVILGHTSEIYTWGSHLWVVSCVGIGLAIIIAERLVIPWLYPLRLTSVYEYFELRFHSKSVRILGSIIGIIWGVLYMGVAMYGPSIALETATGLSVYISIPTMAVICTLYTAIGGMRAVLWTDVFQFLVMMAGIMAVLIKGTMVVGNFSKAMDVCEGQGRLQWHNFDPNPTTRLTTWGIIGYAVNWMYLYGFQQASYQRFTATRSMKDSRMIMLFNVPLVIILLSLTFMIGVFVIAYYSTLQCDPVASGQILNTNELLGLFVKEVFSDARGFMGFFLATLYSGALSSVSSSLSGAAANTWEDIIKIRFSKVSDYKATLINKLLVIVYGFLATSIAFLASTMPGTTTQIAEAFMGAAGGPLLGMFLLGGIFRSAEWIGTLVGGLSSFAICLWLCFMGATVFDRHNIPLPPLSTEGCDNLYHNGSSTAAPNVLTNSSLLAPVTPPNSHEPLSGIEHFYSISYIWYAPIGVVITMVVGIIISLVMQRIRKYETVPDSLLINWREFFLCTIREEDLEGHKTLRTEKDVRDLDVQTPFSIDEEKRCNQENLEIRGGKSNDLKDETSKSLLTQI